MNYRPLRSAALSVVLAAMLMSTACASPPAPGAEHGVFPASEFTTDTLRSSTDEIIDIGIAPLQNLTGNPVLLKSVTIASPPAALQILNVRAYNAAETNGFVLGMEGDLPTECPR